MCVPIALFPGFVLLTRRILKIISNFEKQEQNRKFFVTRPDINRFLTLLADNGVELVAMEPTGGHYSWFWSLVFRHHNIELVWVGHAEVAYFRRHNRLPDKNDQADAMALALLAISNFHNRSFFLHFELGPVERLRELYLQLQSLNRLSSPAVNRTRQQLAREFPEAARCRSEPGPDGLSPLFAFLAGRDRNLEAQIFLLAQQIQNQRGGGLWGGDFRLYPQDVQSLL